MAKVSKNSPDPRVARTRRMLREALFTLLDQKPFEAITVLEIARRADLNAATFYLHYDDKWDLLNSVVGDISAILDEQEAALRATDNSMQHPFAELDVRLFEHIDQHRSFYRHMLGRDGVPSVRYALEQQFQGVVRALLNHMMPAVDHIDVPPALVEHLFGGAYMGVLQWWPSSPDPITPQQLARWIERIEQAATHPDLLTLFGLDDASRRAYLPQ